MRIGFWAELAFLFIRRSWRSTIVLCVMISSAIAALIFLAALAVGTNDTMVRNSVGLFSGHISGQDLPEGLSAKQLSIEGVKGALIRKHRNVWLVHGNRMEAVDLLGVEPALEGKLTALPRKITEGRYPGPQENGVLLGDGVARRLDVRAGGKVRYALEPGKTLGEFAVTGIYRTGAAGLDQGIAICPASVLPGEETTVSAAVFLEEGVDVRDVLQTYSDRFGAGRFTPWTEFMPDLRQLIDLNFVSMAIVMFLVFGIVALSISCAFVIFILRNLREHGIMKAMGVMPLESACLIFAQIALVTVAASIAGVLAGTLACAVFARTGIDLTVFTSHNQYFTVSGVIFPRLTPFSLWLPPGLALVFGVMSAIWPSIFVMRKKAAEILRSV